MVSPQTINRRRLMARMVAAAAALEAPLTLPRRAGAHWPGSLLPPVDRTNDLETIAAGGYVFAYPLVLMDITSQQLTAVPAPTGMAAPVNQFTHSPIFPDPTFVSVASANVDTLYSTAWLDLREEPIVLSVPDTGGRYYLMPIFDAWTNVFASPGARTTGTGAGQFAIVGPGWDDAIPDDLQVLQAPTDMVWVLGRTQTNGKVDYEFVHSLQAQYTLTPLSAWGSEYAAPTDVPVDPAVDTKTAPVAQVAALTAQAFWTQFAELMQTNPPTEADAPMVAQLAQLGIVPGQSLDWEQLSPAMVDALEAGMIQGLATIAAAGKKPAVEIKNTWAMAYGLGDYGANYLLRAGTAWLALGANLPEDAMYPSTRVDSSGQPLNGANRYVLHFEPNQIPPVEAFWSMTMYNDQQFFVPNPIDRYAIGDRDNLAFGPDGSLDIVLQYASPGADDEANWLPTPEGAFNLIMRLYWPKPEVLDGDWAPPAVTKVA